MSQRGRGREFVRVREGKENVSVRNKGRERGSHCKEKFVRYQQFKENSKEC